MRLDEILQLKVDRLFKTYNGLRDKCYGKEMDLSAYETQKSILENFLNKEANKMETADTGEVTYVLALNGYYADTDIEASLKTVKVVLKAMSRGLKVELTASQQMTLDSYLQNVRDCHTKLNEIYEDGYNEYSKLADEVDEYENELNVLRAFIEKLLDKENNDILTEEELELVINATSDMPIEVRHDALIKFREYNHDRYNGNPKNNGKVDVEEFKRCFTDVNISGPKLDRAIVKNEEEISTSANISNTKKILEYFASINLLDKFEVPVLMTICIYGNADTCKRLYEEMLESEFDLDLCISVPSVWIDNTRKTGKKSYTRKGGSGATKEPTLRAAAHGISFKEYKANKDYLTSKGLTVSNDDIGIRRTMAMPNARVKEAVELLEQYGLLTDENRGRFKIYLLSSANLSERLDRLVELGLLNGEADGRELNDYARNYVTAIHAIDVPVYSVLYREKQTRTRESYYDTIASTKRGQLSGDLTKKMLGNDLDTFDKLQAYNRTNFVDTTKDIPEAEKYEEIISRSTATDIDPRAFDEVLVARLEEESKINDFVYRIGNVDISRLKVLRNLSALLRAGVDDIDGFFYSLYRGSLLTPESYDQIRRNFVSEVVPTQGGAK